MTVKLRKVKRPGGVFSFDARFFTEDARGEWLYLPTGSSWEAEHDVGKLPFDVLVLMRPSEWFVSWWVDDRMDRRVELDICLPPERTEDGWSFVDLELDCVRHHTGVVSIDDRGEFEAACRAGSIPEAEAETALATATAMALKLLDNDEPWGEAGWRRLAEAQRQE
jgi:uncharacterized protein DUF402